MREKDFLMFTMPHDGYTFEQTLDLLLAEVGGHEAGASFGKRPMSSTSTVTSFAARRMTAKAVDRLAA